MSWNVLCPGCGGVLETAGALKTLNRHEYFCSLCAEGHEPTLDNLIEVTFTVNPRIRRIAAHDPDSLSHAEYMRQIFWGSGSDLPEDIESAVGRVTLDQMELGPGERASMSLTLPQGFIIAFDPVTHASMFLDVSGEETQERRTLSLVFAESHAHSGTLTLPPGPLRITFENKAARRTLPALWVHGEELGALSDTRRPFLTATRLLSNQTFRDLYRSGTFDPEQRFKITSLTILFTDLERLDGALRPGRRPRGLRSRAQPLRRADRGGRAEGGAVVKTIGDAVMATFTSPDRALRAAMRMREAMRQINAKRGSEDLALNIGLHEGPCLAVMLDDRQDYFGQTVNIAARVQGLAEPTAVLATQPVVQSAEAARLLQEAGYRTTSRLLNLRGVSEAFQIYEIREGEQLAAA